MLHYVYLNKYNRVLYSDKNIYKRYFFKRKKRKVDILPVKYDIIVSKRYHGNGDEIFKRSCDYVGYKMVLL